MRFSIHNIIPCFQPNIIISGVGVPLLSAIIYRSLKCVKVLIKVSIFLIINHCYVMILLTLPVYHLPWVDVHHEHSIAQSILQGGADVNCKGSMITPLVFATMQGEYTNYIKLLLKAGADPNIPDDVCSLYLLDIILTWYADFQYILVKLMVILLLFKSSDNVGKLFSNEFMLLCVIDYANAKIYFP
jgi:ankyrin repeat protein